MEIKKTKITYSAAGAVDREFVYIGPDWIPMSSNLCQIGAGLGQIGSQVDSTWTPGDPTGPPGSPMGAGPGLGTSRALKFDACA